jgi:hypothetical protein
LLTFQLALLISAAAAGAIYVIAARQPIKKVRRMIRPLSYTCLLNSRPGRDGRVNGSDAGSNGIHVREFQRLAPRA